MYLKALTPLIRKTAHRFLRGLRKDRNSVALQGSNRSLAFPAVHKPSRGRLIADKYST